MFLFNDLKYSIYLRNTVTLQYFSNEKYRPISRVNQGQIFKRHSSQQVLLYASFKLHMCVFSMHLLTQPTRFLAMLFCLIQEKLSDVMLIWRRPQFLQASQRLSFLRHGKLSLVNITFQTKTLKSGFANRISGLNTPLSCLY